MTTTEVATLKRTELQATACRQFGKGAAAWTGRATKEELREALISGEVPTKFANGNGQQQDLALAIAAAINPLLQAQLDEQGVRELIDARMADVAALVEAKLAERQTVAGEGTAAGEALSPSGGAGAVAGTPVRRGWREGEGRISGGIEEASSYAKIAEPLHTDEKDAPANVQPADEQPASKCPVLQ